MTHDEAREKDIRDLLERRPEIVAVIAEGKHAGWDVSKIYEEVHARLGLEVLCDLSLASDQRWCRATHPVLGSKCRESHGHHGPHRFNLEWWDTDDLPPS